jgi:hypothetical protein
MSFFDFSSQGMGWSMFVMKSDIDGLVILAPSPRGIEPRIWSD